MNSKGHSQPSVIYAYELFICSSEEIKRYFHLFFWLTFQMHFNIIRTWMNEIIHH